MNNKPLLIEDFSSGHFEKGIGFKYFVPAEINFQWTWNDPTLNTLLEDYGFVFSLASHSCN